jgi:hypothetical protein
MIVSPLRALGGLMAVLAVVLLLEWVVPGRGDATVTPGGLHLIGASPKAQLQVRATAAWTNDVLARPLFSISRRPPKIVPGNTGNADAGGARLAGILIGRFWRRAIFAPDGGGKPLVLGEGEAVNDTSIRKIEADKVVLASGEVLKPAFDKNRVPTPYTPPFQPPPFQPGAPNFPNPNFINGQIQPPGFPRAPQLQQQQQDGDAGQENGQVAPAPGQPIFRQPMIPNRRE